MANASLESRFTTEHDKKIAEVDILTQENERKTPEHNKDLFSCTECQRSFTSPSGLKQHQHTHKSVKPFQCNVCQKSYTQFSNLCRHKRMHVECQQKLECFQCNLTFPNLSTLSKHRQNCAVHEKNSQGHQNGHEILKLPSNFTNFNQNTVAYQS